MPWSVYRWRPEWGPLHFWDTLRVELSSFCYSSCEPQLPWPVRLSSYISSIQGFFQAAPGSSVPVCELDMLSRQQIGASFGPPHLFPSSQKIIVFHCLMFKTIISHTVFSILVFFFWQESKYDLYYSIFSRSGYLKGILRRNQEIDLSGS